MSKNGGGPLSRYQADKSYDWNYDHPPEPVRPGRSPPPSPLPGEWDFCGLPVDSPLGVPAGPLLNGAWCLYYASLGFDVVTYKTVRSGPRECYSMPNLQPVACGSLSGGEDEVAAADRMSGSWAVSYGMPSKAPDVWRRDIERTRRDLPARQKLSVSVVGTVQAGWTIEQLADDYATCAAWAVESGADAVEMNFSCPNVDTCDGQLFQQPEDAGVVAATVRRAIGRTPLIAKIGRIVEPADAERLLDHVSRSIDALAMTNSIATTVRGDDGRLMFDGQRRGICGAATRVASTEQTRALRELIERRGESVKLIGVGGAGETRHVKDYLAAGAHAVHVATAAMIDPGLALRIRDEWSV